ncbi:MAG: hypothetical protein QG591_2369 [Planctomycetota bacterium]|nr:hypothetical protein [Planctomycetota bacterium]
MMVLGKKNLTIPPDTVVRNIPINPQPTRYRNFRRFTGFPLFFVASNITLVDLHYYYDADMLRE